MPDPAIEAALEAAGAELAVRWNADMEFGAAAAISVAAFLRALADAVEEAARDG